MDKGADPTPFMLNAVILSPLSTKFLVEHDLLDLNYQLDSTGRTLLDFIELRNLVHPYQQYLLPDKSNELFYATTQNDLITLQNSLQNVNKALPNVYGTPYLYALSLGNINAVNILLSKNAYTKFKTPFGKFALAFAVESKNPDAVAIALRSTSQNEIDSVFHNKRGMEQSILERAINTGCPTSVFSLLLSGIIKCSPDILCQGITPTGWLGYAVSNRDLKFENHIDVFKLLVDSGAKVDSYNSILRYTPRDFYIYQLRSLNYPPYILIELSKYKKTIT